MARTKSAAQETAPAPPVTGLTGPLEHYPACPAELTGRAIYWQMHCAMQDFAQAGLAKTRDNEQQGFKFRGIDELMNLAAPIFVRHGILVVPTVTSRTMVERETRNRALMFNVALDVTFTFTSALDGSTIEAKTCGEAQDSGDKATNKAMSAAFKYALLQVFCVPLEGEGADADQTTPEQSVRRKAPTAEEQQLAGVVEATKQLAAIEARKGTAALQRFFAQDKAEHPDVWRVLTLSPEHKPDWKAIKGIAEDADALAQEQASATPA